jgi:hypothetical protein
MGYPGQLQKAPQIPALLPQGGRHREEAVRQIAPLADWTPWLILR